MGISPMVPIPATQYPNGNVQNNGTHDLNYGDTLEMSTSEYYQHPSSFCKALHDYQSNDPAFQSLVIQKGDIIEVLAKNDSGWWDGLLRDRRGWFPSNYVSPITATSQQSSSTEVPAEVAPRWFQEALDTALAPVQKELRATKDGVQTVITELQSIKVDLQKVQQKLRTENTRGIKAERIATKTHNRISGDGFRTSWLTVPFVDGDNPEDDPHNLPGLRNVACIRNLTTDQVMAYLKGHGLKLEGEQLEERAKVAIAEEIGYFESL